LLPKKAKWRTLIIRQLTRKFGELGSETIESIHQLTLEQLESLGDALLDFNAIEDLRSWLNNN
jgi:heme oxygenase